jgi:hypothetical protein
MQSLISRLGLFTMPPSGADLNVNSDGTDYLLPSQVNVELDHHNKEYVNEHGLPIQRLDALMRDGKGKDE